MYELAEGEELGSTGLQIGPGTGSNQGKGARRPGQLAPEDPQGPLLSHLGKPRCHPGGAGRSLLRDASAFLIKMEFREIAVLTVNPAYRPRHRAHHDGVGFNDATEFYPFEQGTRCHTRRGKQAIAPNHVLNF